MHFGTPDDTRVIMINAGPGSSYRSNLEPRLRQLSMARFEANPVPIELFIVGDRDEDKTGGLVRLLSNMVETDSTGERIAEVRGIWANIFRIAGEQKNFRSHIRKLIDGLRIPLNEPFDHHVMRRASGRTVVNMPGGLEITVLAPGEHRLTALHEMSAQEARKIGGEIETLLAETFSRIAVETDPAPLRIANRVVDAQSACTPSENAQRLAGGSYIDAQIGNLASTVALFRFRDRTFLFTGDSRGDEILAGLSSAAMLDDHGEATVDLMTIPHLGSDRNITVDFFRRVKASGYLFSGDGRHGNPATTTVAALVTARGCDPYRMYFVNRDGATLRPDPALDESTAAAPSRKVNRRQEDDPLGTRLDAFFKDEQRFNPNYRRVFRSSSSGSVIIDLLHPMRY